MKGYIAFTKKEFTEQFRTYKVLIMLAVFFVFGMTSPVLAKMMPKIFSSFAVEGFNLTIPTPTYMDAYAQFFKNMTQMCLLVFILVFCGSLAQELTKGTLVNILSKGMSRQSVILSKFTASLALWTVSYLVAVLTDYGYTLYYFGSHPAKHLILSLFCLWLFGAFILSLIYVTSTITSGNFGALIMTVVTLVVLIILNIPPKFKKFNPVYLASDNVGIMSGTVKSGDIMVTVWITAAATVFLLILSLYLFGKKKL